MYARLALLLIFLLAPQKQPDRKQDPQKQVLPPASNQAISDSSRSVSEIKFYTYNSQESGHAETIKIVSDILLAAFTLALVWVGYRQWITLREHEKWMQKNVETVMKIASAAKDGADAALLNAQAVIKSERSWITGIVGDDSFRLFGNPATVPKFWLAIKNSGRTPGKLARVLMRFETRSNLDDLRGIEHEFFFTDICPIPYVLVVPGDLPFQISVTISGDKPLNMAEMNEVKDGKKFLVAYGVIEYEDVFDFGSPDKNHKSGFFFYYAYGGPTSHGFQTYYSVPSDYLQVT
jgi:hypothetical protein